MQVLTRSLVFTFKLTILRLRYKQISTWNVTIETNKRRLYESINAFEYQKKINLYFNYSETKVFIQNQKKKLEKNSGI